MHIKSTEIEDTFAEAFKMYGSRIIITAETKEWAIAAAQSITGFATSVIGCQCEAGIETELDAKNTPDKRPGVSVLLFSMTKKSLGERLLERIGQCIMTCPTTACYNGITAGDAVQVGGKLKYFGDGYQISKVLDNTKYWRIPVMDGEFFIEDIFNVKPSVGGGNILILGENQAITLTAAIAAKKAMEAVADIVLPFPNGVVRSGSKVGSRYKSLIASTNEAYCPSLTGVITHSALDECVNCVLEIVIDGLNQAAIETAMRVGVMAAAMPGIKKISAGNYGGNLGDYHLSLHQIMAKRI